MVAGEAQEESQEPPTCLVRQLEEPAPRDVDIIVGTIAVVVQGLAPHLYRPAQLIHLLLQPAMRGDARNVPRYGGRRILRKETNLPMHHAGNSVYLHQALVCSAHFLLYIHLQLAQLLHLWQRGTVVEARSNTNFPVT